MLVAAGCSDREVILPGERLAAASLLDPEAVVSEPVNTSVKFSAPRQTSNTAWTLPYGDGQSRFEHLAFSSAPQEIWTAEIGQGDGRRNRIVADPVVAQGRIFTLDALSQLVATSEAGVTLWTKALTPTGENPGDADGGGMTYANETLFVATGYGDLFAFDPATGREKWRQRLLGAGNARPVYRGGVLYLTSNDNTGWAIEADTGRIRWETDGLSDDHNIAGQTAPAVSDKFVVFPFGSGQLQTAFRQGGLVMWSASLSGGRQGHAIARADDIPTQPIISGDRVYAANSAGRIVALDVNSGDRIWTSTHGARGPLWLAGNSIFFVNDQANLVRLNARDGDFVWAQELPKYTVYKPRRSKTVFALHGPVLAGGQVIVASNDGVIRFFDPTSGALTRQMQVEAGATTNPVFANGTMYLVTTDGKLRAFR
jgi:outer membrane protein assembly factor BamB